MLKIWVAWVEQPICLTSTLLALQDQLVKAASYVKTEAVEVEKCALQILKGETGV